MLVLLQIHLHSSRHSAPEFLISSFPTLFEADSRERESITRYLNGIALGPEGKGSHRDEIDSIIVVLK